jgi:hypothetical protein
MRDGIPRTLPVPRKWQVFVECADRPADRGTERVVTRLSEAIQFCLSKLFPRDGRESLIKLTSDTQPSLPGLRLEGIAARPQIGSGQNHNVPELIVDTRALVQQGQAIGSALRDALAARIEAEMVAHRRLIVEDLAGKIRPPELKRFSDEFDRAAACIDSSAEAEKFLSEPTADAKSLNKSIKADEDLR